MPRYSEKAKLIAAAVFGGVVVISGAATAATGSLPLVSHGQQHSHPTPQNPSDDQGDDTGDDTGTTTPDTDTNTNSNEKPAHATAVTDAAHAPKPTDGTTHGQAVCTVASDGKCHTGGQAGDSHGQSDLPHGKAHQDNATTNRQNTTHANTSHANTLHGKSTLPHGKATLPHGKSGQ